MENQLYFDYKRAQSEMIRALIAQPSMIPAVSKYITANDFSIGKYKEAYREVFKIYTEGDEISKSKLYNQVYKNAEIELSEEDIYEFFNDESPVEPPTELAKILKKESVKEKTHQMIEKTAKEIEKPGNPLLESLGATQREIEALALDLMPKETITFKDQLEMFDKSVRDTSEKREGIPSFYKSLDHFTGGWFPEQLITVAARTSVGKSVVAVNCALAAALNNKSVLFFSLEMGHLELISRLVSCKSFLKLNKVYPTLDLNNDEMKLYNSTIKELKELPIIIEDTPEVSLDYIKSRAIEESKTEKGVDFIIIDYIQLINTKALAGKSRQEHVAEISRSLKVLAKQLKVPVLVVAQLNRESKDDEDRLPSKADIRESAAIAADSDVVLIIHRKYRDTSGDPKALFILDKNRNGPADKKISVRSMLDRALFQDIIEEEKKENSEESDDFFSDSSSLDDLNWG